MKKKIVVNYIRVSTNNHIDKDSLAEQKRELISYCENVYKSKY